MDFIPTQDEIAGLDDRTRWDLYRKPLEFIGAGLMKPIRVLDQSKLTDDELMRLERDGFYVSFSKT